MHAPSPSLAASTTRATLVPTACEAATAMAEAGSGRLMAKRASERCSAMTLSRNGGSACCREGKSVASTAWPAKDAAAAGTAAARSEAANADAGTSGVAFLPLKLAPGVSTFSVSSIAVLSSASMRDAVCACRQVSRRAAEDAARLGRRRLGSTCRAQAGRTWDGRGCSRKPRLGAALVVALMSAFRMPRVITARCRRQCAPCWLLLRARVRDLPC